MDIEYPAIGICGLSCRLCPRYQTSAASKCHGCKSKERIATGCVFISCALKREGVEFCWDCRKNETCERWRNHRAAGKKQDSFKSYQKLEADIGLIKDEGIEAFNQLQKARESRLLKFLTEFNDGRSRSYYCIAVTVMTLDELDGALEEGVRRSNSQEIMDRTKMMHALLDRIAFARGYQLRLRKPD